MVAQVRVYRVCKEKYSEDVLDGEGGLIAGGRWHTQGWRIVYCASSESLAVLEYRVHLGRHLPVGPYMMHIIDVPGTCISKLRIDRLPNEWRAVPHGPASQRIGDEWLESRRSTALRVPSVHISSDTNILLNPEHTDMGLVRVVSRTPYAFDSRLFVQQAVRLPQK